MNNIIRSARAFTLPFAWLLHFPPILLAVAVSQGFAEPAAAQPTAAAKGAIREELAASSRPSDLFEKKGKRIDGKVVLQVGASDSGPFPGVTEYDSTSADSSTNKVYTSAFEFVYTGWTWSGFPSDALVYQVKAEWDIDANYIEDVKVFVDNANGYDTGDFDIDITGNDLFDGYDETSDQSHTWGLSGSNRQLNQTWWFNAYDSYDDSGSNPDWDKGRIDWIRLTLYYTYEAPDPDLIVVDGSIGVTDTTVNPGQIVTVSWTAKNQGGADAGSTRQGVMWSPNSTITTGDDELANEFLGSMNAGETSPETNILSIPSNAVTGSTYYIGVIADYENDEVEGSAGEANNNDATPIAVTINAPPPPGAPGTPDLSSADDTGHSSSDDITYQTSGLTFSWSAASGAVDGYYYEWNDSSPDSTTTGTSVSLNAPSGNGWHTFYVQAYNSGGRGPARSRAVYIDRNRPFVSSVDLRSSDDTGISSTDNITSDTNCRFTWNANANGGSGIYRSYWGWNSSSTNNSTANEYADVSPPSNNGTYTFYVIAEAESGLFAYYPDYSDQETVTWDTTAPGIPANLQVSGGEPTLDTTPLLTWNPVSSASRYHVQVENFLQINYESGYSSTSSYQVQNLLPLGTIYWKVRSEDTAGNESSYSPRDDFEIIGPTINSVRWEDASGNPLSGTYDEGTTVYLSVDATGFGTSETFSADILEDDLAPAPNQDVVFDIPIPHHSGSKWRASWQAEWVDDIAGDPEYFFTLDTYGDSSGNINIRPIPDIAVSPHQLTPSATAQALAALASEQPSREEPNRALDAQPLSAVAVLTLPWLDNQELLLAAEQRPRAAPFRFAEAIAISATTATHGTWEMLPHGRRLWRLRIVSPEAQSLSLGFTDYFMPAGGTLLVYSAQSERTIGPFTENDNEEHGQLWTPIIRGDTLVIEVAVPAENESDLRLTIGRVNHGFRALTPNTKIGGTSGSCNLDVACPAGDDWRDQMRSVGAYTVNGTDTCTGALINNTALDRRPYFLTADHCGIGAADAPSVVVYWNFENSYCRPPGSTASGNSGDGDLLQFNTGAVFRADYAASDMTLLELDDPIDAGYNVSYGGWDRTGGGSTPGSAVGIHHPGVEEKRFSLEVNATTLAAYQGAPGSGTDHIRVGDWDLGTTEPGSSGSPLFGPNGRIIGQLHGGFAACGNNQPDWYGRLHTSWTGGGSDATRLSNWLDPLGTGANTLDGFNSSETSFGVYAYGGTGLRIDSITEEMGSSWLTVNPPSSYPITVSPGEFIIVGISIDSSGLAAGDYSEHLVISSNDPNESPYPDGVEVNVTVAPSTCYPLTLTNTGSGGVPTPSPGSSSGCPAGGYVAGESIQLTASPAAGWSVGSWSGTDNNASTSTTNTVTMPTAARTATANYVTLPPACYALTLTKTGSGLVPTASPTNSSGCSVGAYVAGESIQLTASPASGWSVGSWSGTNNDASTSSTNMVTMPSSPHTGTVNYVELPPPACEYVVTSPNGGETWYRGDPYTIEWTASGSDCGPNVHLETYKDGIFYRAIFSGTSNDGSQLWGIPSDYAASGQYRVRVTDTSDPSYTAESNGDFTITGLCYGLILTHTGSGSDPVPTPDGSVGCSSGEYVAGELIQLTASPLSGWSVASWSGTDNNTSTSTMNTVTMPSSAHTATVNYEQPPCSVGVQDLLLQDDSVTGLEVHEACNSITAGPNFVIYGPNGHAILRAPLVVLRDGFSVGVDGSLTISDQALLEDSFDDNSIDPALWEYGGNTVTETANEFRIDRTVTDAGGWARALPITISPTKTITLVRRAKVYAANDYFDGTLSFTFVGYPEYRFGVSYANYYYTGNGACVTIGFSLFRNNANSHNCADQQTDVTAAISPLWGQWFEERLVYDPVTGDLYYFIDDALRLSHNVGPLPAGAESLEINFGTWGWWTGHYQHMDDLVLSQ